MKKLFILFILPAFISTHSFAQNEVKITLNEVLAQAHEQSLDAFKAKNSYLASYWAYRSYKANSMPHLDLELRPFTYNRSMTLRYDVNQDIDVYREQQTLNSYGNLSLSQNVGLTGGSIYIDSDINRLVNFSTENIKTYSVTPIRIGIIQPLFAYNEFKWERQIEPLKFKKAKKEFIRKQQDINIQAVNLYFNFLQAYLKKTDAEKNLKTTEDLYKIGEKRFAIASIDKDDLLNLELNKYNAEVDLAVADKNLARSRFNLNSFLGQKEDYLIIPTVPSVPSGFNINIEEAVRYAFELNPELLKLKQTALEAEMMLEKTIRNNRLKVNLSASYGLNQRAEEFNDLFSELLDQEMIAINMYIPILDWGERKGKKEMAIKQKEVAEIEIKQAEIDFEQEVSLKVIDFNIQEKLVHNTAKADTISMESFNLTEKRFRMGQADVLKLTTAMTAQQRARENYINNLHSYWKNYYEIQQLTLYDFVNDIKLEEDFDKIIGRE